LDLATWEAQENKGLSSYQTYLPHAWLHVKPYWYEGRYRSLLGA